MESPTPTPRKRNGRRVLAVGDIVKNGRAKVIRVNSNGTLHIRYRSGKKATIVHPGVDMTSDEPAHQNVWILKPSGGQCGSNIFLADNLSTIKTTLKRAAFSGGCVIVQKYIEKPLTLLPHGRKFDIRAWVLVTARFEVCVFREGVLRTACEPFTMDGPNCLTKKFVHLTNHCIQKKHRAFGAWEEGNEMLWSQFEAYLRANEKFNFNDDIYPRMCNVIIATIKAIQDRFDSPTQKFHSFQLFGYDFMVTHDAQVLLLEINSSPAICERLLPRMSQAMVDMSIHREFPPRTPKPVLPPDPTLPNRSNQPGRWVGDWHVIYVAKSSP